MLNISDARRPFMRRTAACAVVLLLVSSPAVADEAEVKIDNFTFSPETVTVKAGTKVTFHNGDDIPHTVVGMNREFRSKALDTGDSFSVTLDKPGAITYFCGLHPHMKGKITVTP